MDGLILEPGRVCFAWWVWVVSIVYDMVPSLALGCDITLWEHGFRRDDGESGTGLTVFNVIDDIGIP